MVTEPAIELAGLDKAFEAKGRRTVALDGIDLRVPSGQFVVVLGPSGCGKTTLLRIVGGLLAPTAGEVRVLGRPLARDGAGPDRETLAQLGFVFQQPNLMPWRTVRQNVELPLELRGVPAAERRRVSDGLLRLVSLDGFADAHPRQLSGGMAQRVAIARALSYDPPVLLADEPFGALDAQTRDGMNLELQRIWMQSGKTVVLVTHSIPEAVFLADRVVLLSAHPGRLRSITDVPFPRPRASELTADPEFTALVAHLREELKR
jgi:NitT/TauT family transport system ATP-binding protein